MKLLAWTLVAVPVATLVACVVKLWCSKDRSKRELARDIITLVIIFTLLAMFIAGFSMLMAGDKGQ